MAKEVELITPKKLEKISSLVLRGEYLDLVKAYKKSLTEIERLERSIERDKESAANDLNKQAEKYEMRIARLRAGRDKRLNKASWRVFRKNQQVFRLQQVLQRKKPFYKKPVKLRKRELTKEARDQGFQKGLQRNIRVRRKDAWREGWKAGYQAARERAKKERGGMIYRSGSVDSIARCALMVQKLMGAIGLTPEYISIMLLAGQYESFLFEELKSSFEQIEGDLFYKRILYLLDRGYVHRVGMRNCRKIWALTPLGEEIHKRMKAYIGRNLKETYK